MANGYRLRELKIEVTRECPLKCLHCSSNGAPLAPERLDPRRVAELIREFADLGGNVLAISGGEPLVYNGLPILLKVCQSLGIRPDIYTSGICSNRFAINPIADYTLSLLAEIRANIIFSLHGASAETHDILTQVPGSFNSSIEAMEKAVAAGIPAEVHVVPTAINFGELAQMVMLVSNMGIRRLSWLRFVPQGRGQVNRDVLQLTREQLRQLSHIKIKLQQVFPDVEIRTGSPFNILCTEAPTLCVAGISELTIRPDGCAVPCDAFKQFRVHDRFCNVLEHSLLEVWQKSEFLNEVRCLQESKCNSPCASCPYYSLCNSGCMAQTAIATGRLVNERDPACLVGYPEVERADVEAVTIS